MKRVHKWILSLLLGGDAKSWKEMFRIACECNENCKKILGREECIIKRYSAIIDRENAILEAVRNSSDFQLMSNVVEILNSGANMEGGADDENA